jgi:hypothetical protein
LCVRSRTLQLTDYFRQIETENMGITPCEAAIEKTIRALSQIRRRTVWQS